MSAEGLVLTDTDFQTRLAQAKGILLFYKRLCPNCKALEKMLDKFLTANPEVSYLRIDSEESPEAMKAFSIERVPTIFVLREGQVVARKVGLMNLREMIDFYQMAQE